VRHHRAVRGGRLFALATAVGVLLAGLLTVAVIDSAAADTTPLVTAVSPPSGLTTGGTTVTVTGSGFTGAVSVFFGRVQGSAMVVGSDTSLTVTSPPGAVAGTVDVTVQTATASSPLGPLDRFTYVAPGPPATVSSVTPDSGLTGGGASVNIVGTGFSGIDSVDFGATAATLFLVNSATSITAISPSGAAGTVDVTVTTPNGPSAIVSSDQFTYVNPGPGPTVTEVTPNAGTTAGGIPIAVTGTAFTGANTVAFGNVDASFVVNSDTSITATAPVQLAGVVDITVTTPNGTSPANLSDQYTITAPVPVVTSVSPSTGSYDGGDSVTVNGSGFVFATAVTFGTTPATSYVVNSDTSITVTSPAVTTAGVVDVTVTTAGGTSAIGPSDQFTYFIPPPVVTSISPNIGSTGGGTQVTITGTGFGGATAVDFGSTGAEFAVVTHQSITASSPAVLAPGTVDITVTTSIGTSPKHRADKFTFSPPPVVNVVKPNSGPSFGGTMVTVKGMGFKGTTAVDFGNIPATSFILNSDRSITVASPAEAPGTVDITVVTSHGTSVLGPEDQFTFGSTTAPVVTGIAPRAGFTTTKPSGETTITITGRDFTQATAVTFVFNPPVDPPVPATSFVVTSDTSITAVSPEQKLPAIMDVTVTTALGTSAAVPPDLFTFLDPGPVASVTGVSPDSGPNTGGSNVVVTGDGLSGATVVDFGTVPATFTLNEITGSLDAVAPPQKKPGTVDVTVKTPNGVSAVNARDQFIYTNPQIPPVVTHIRPHDGPTTGGSAVTIRGSGFEGTTVVRFGSVTATFVVDSNELITATAPAEAAGTVDITVKTENGTSVKGPSDQFTYKVPRG